MKETSDVENRWSEQASATFIGQSEIFVPARAEQTATLLDLIPAHPDEEFTVVELASGEGILARAIMEHFPRCHYIALDGSQTMREHMRRSLSTFQERLDIRGFELSGRDWHKTLPEALRCVVSSLSVHHLSDAEKRQLFRTMFARLEVGGALLLADIVKPVNQQIADLFARQYDEIVRQQSLAIRGDLSGYELFQEEHWNYFVYDYNDPHSYDHPSFLHDQLRWLIEVRFSYADCFWMRAGHAIYGAYK